ncbi:MAG: DUF2225 domain-containing protein [Lachnoclostridium sp.]|jgi:uncharacterized protein (DUF2225 family)|nr:DUF2225 domain-containing protein [Lachnoclostridium sp.]
MEGLLGGLEEFGLKNTDNIKIFEDANSDGKGENDKVDKKKEFVEEDFLFDKTFECPVCDFEFKSKMIRTGKVKLLAVDLDLRPRYQGVDCLKYDAIMCPRCGYTALSRYFSFVMAKQVKAIKTEISQTFTNPEPEMTTYSYDTAISRHKLALLNAVVKNAKCSEKAYICLKLSWLLRGKQEELLQVKKQDDEEVKKLKEEELKATAKSHEGFTAAFSTEIFPMCGMDQYTVMFLVAVMSFRLGKKEETMRWISEIMIAKDAQPRIKDKARDLKELVMKARKDENK